ncbi:MAG: hypothetical protein EOP53_02630 [Sphingobacteriales bacterium]|nr:MAG: hypothetical protein EOP53_02630 [Sphingobacteriales bacterium]
MKSITLKELIGSIIENARYIYIAANEHGLQEFHSYFMLEQGAVIEFPVYDDECLMELSPENINYMKQRFNNGNDLQKIEKAFIEGQKIEDIYFIYENGEIDFSNRAYIKLSNNTFITEQNFGPIGVTEIDLLIFTELEWIERVKRLQQNVKSYLKDVVSISNIS